MAQHTLYAYLYGLEHWRYLGWRAGRHRALVDETDASPADDACATGCLRIDPRWCHGGLTCLSAARFFANTLPPIDHQRAWIGFFLSVTRRWYDVDLRVLY